jgi:hypothetical protein
MTGGETMAKKMIGVISTITFACIPAVRILGIALEGTANQYHLTALCIELATCALAAVAWRGLRRTES